MGFGLTDQRKPGVAVGVEDGVFHRFLVAAQVSHVHGTVGPVSDVFAVAVVEIRFFGGFVWFGMEVG